MSRPPYLSHLRILLPVDELPVRERERWSSYGERAPERTEVAARQFADTVRRLAGRPPVTVPPVESTDGIVVDVRGRRYVCPEQPRLRSWYGLRQDAGATVTAAAGPHEAQVPMPPVPGAAVSPTVRDQAAADLASYVEGGGEVRLFSRTSTWHVPLAWFVLFSPDERQLRLPGARRRGGRPATSGGPDVGERRSLRYVTEMSSARRRCAIALRTVRRHLEDRPVAAEIEQIGRWLEEFHPHCLVELDYAGLVELMDDLHLSGDDSVADVAAQLEALAEGDSATAAAAYRRFATRWSRVALMARSS